MSYGSDTVMSKTTAFPCTQTDCEYGILLPLVMNIIVGPTIVIKVFLLRHRLWMPICLKIILFLLHCSEKATFLLSFIYTCDIIWPPAPFESCYQARNLKEVARACRRTMSACLLTGQKRRQLLGGSSHSDSVPVL